VNWAGGSSIWLRNQLTTDPQKQMKANELLKKLGNTLLGKKVNTPAAGDVATVTQLAPEEKAPEIAFRVHDGLGVIQLHQDWKN
jgi:hypothetical protein